MDDASSSPPRAASEPVIVDEVSPEPFPLAGIRKGNLDKLGNRIFEVFWCGSDYAVYRTSRGVFVNFSDRPEKERAQRLAFAEISPELCELRFLTSEMRRPYSVWPRLGRDAQRGGDADSIYDHNIAQAIMLLMEGRPQDAKRITKAALSMAVTRSTNDNTIRYIMACVFSAAAVIVALGLGATLTQLATGRDVLENELIASIFGVLGAAFSIITRIQAFKAKPCQQSNMNYWMGGVRIAVGFLGGGMLFLVAGSPIGQTLANPTYLETWQGAAVIGFLGGFAERLVQTIFRRTAAAMDESSGTAVQLARQSELDDRNVNSTVKD